MLTYSTVWSGLFYHLRSRYYFLYLYWLFPFD